MKAALLIIVTLLFPTAAGGQAIGSDVEVVTTYSENGKFYLRSIPYDNEFPSLRGVTYVYETGKAAPLYVFERGFDSVDEGGNNLILSDDGEVIFYAITWDADESKEGLKSINVYKHGRIIRSYTETEINGCDKKRERCSLVYSNDERVADAAQSNLGTADYKKVFKGGADEKEKFLSDFAVFSSGDTVYLTDSKRRVHTFDLRDGSLVGSAPFDDVYEQIKGKARPTRTELRGYDAPTLLTLPPLKGGAAAEAALAARLGMVFVDISEKKNYQYKWYSIKVRATLRRDGRLEVEELDADAGLPREKVVEFFEANRFDSGHVPAVFDKWHLGEDYYFFRKRDARLARKEKREELARERAERERRLTAESIGGVYVPQNLGECLTELDKLLPEVDKKEMLALPKRDDMMVYHLGLGTWMRNNWGLWGGSRLQKYFMDRGVRHPEEMSSVVLYHYHDWLGGRKETWRDWEKRAARLRPGDTG